MDKKLTKLPCHFPGRWITQIQNGIVTLVQRIAEDEFVICAHDLPAICANEEFVTDEQARAIILSIHHRLK